MMRQRANLASLILVLSARLLQPLASAEELASAPVYSVAEIVFAGPQQSAADVPARDVHLAVCFRHESGSPEFTVQGFFDGDGQGGVEGDVFKVRFCPTRSGGADRFRPRLDRRFDPRRAGHG